MPLLPKAEVGWGEEPPTTGSRTITGREKERKENTKKKLEQPGISYSWPQRPGVRDNGPVSESLEGSEAKRGTQVSCTP